MNYRKYEVGPYNLHFINMDKFKTISIVIHFKRKIKKEELTLRNLLTKVLLESSKKYPSGRLIEIETENLYNLYIGSSVSKSGNYAIMTFRSSFLKDKYTEDGLLEQAIKFINSIIFEPDVEDNKFNKKSFDIAYNLVKEQIESIRENPNMYAGEKMLENMDRKSSMSYSIEGYLKDLEKINEKNLYEYYKSVLNSDLVDIFILGNLEEEKVKKVMLETFKVNTIKKPGEEHFIEYSTYRSKNKIVHEKLEGITQAKLKIGCKTDKLTDFEKKYVMPIYSSILGGSSNSKLFQTVREKNSLCYSISSSYSPLNNILTISAGINKEDFRKTLRLIKKELKNMEKGIFSDEDLESSKIITLNAYKTIEDSAFSIIGIYASHAYLGFDLLDKRKKEIVKVTKEMIMELSHKIHVDTVYVLEGDDKDEAKGV